MADTSTQTQQDPVDLINQLAQWAKNNGTQAPNNVPQSSSPGMTAGYVASNPNSLNGQSSNAGFVSGNNTVPGQQGGMAVANGNGTDLGTLLQGLIKQAQTPNSGGQNQGGMAVNAYQKGVNKALQQAGEAHATQAVQAGMNPNDVANHPMMQGGPEQTQQVQVPTGQPQQPQTSSIPDNINQLNQKTAYNTALKAYQSSLPQNFMQRFSQNFTKMTGGVTQADQLANSQAIQKIAGAEPIQPEDVAKMNIEARKAALEASSQAISADTNKMTAYTDLIPKLEADKGWWAKANAAPSQDQKNLISGMATTAKDLNQRLLNHDTLINNINPSAQQTSNKIQQGVDPAAIAEARKRGLIK